jgi:hypothetical protein
MASQSSERSEWLKCTLSCAYFIHNYCQIYDATIGEWIPFTLWPSQLEVLNELVNNRLCVIVKARQLGQTWLVLCFILWKMLFFPSFTALLFSRRENEAIYLLGVNRLRGVYSRLPKWMQVRQVLTSASHEWVLSNGSVAYAFPTTAGDSYTASYAFVDEADLVPDLGKLMSAVKPTIDGGGGMTLLSRVDKSTPSSQFKRIYIDAKLKKNSWKPIFLPWSARPGRTVEWYATQKADALSRTGSLDELHEQYPATDAEALKPPTLDRRIPYTWLEKVYYPMLPIDSDLSLPNLVVYQNPVSGAEYYVAADPAEGNPESDDSVVHVISEQGEECAVLAGKIEPGMFADYIDQLSIHYNYAEILPERNNHGHAVILSLKDVHNRDVMYGWNGTEGWMSSSRGKALMYTRMAETARDRECVIHNEETFMQLTSIDGNTLAAPEGRHDDYATSFSLGMCARAMGGAHAEFGNSPSDGYRG